MTRNFPFTIKQVAKILKLKVRYECENSGNIDTDCPFCQKKSKLNLNAAKNVYRCNFCGEHGGMVGLYGKVHDISNADAYREICEILGCNDTSHMNSDLYTPKENSSQNTQKSPGRADNNIIHQTYSMLLSMLTLAAPHKDQLLAKGLSQGHIKKFNFKSVPAFGQQGLCEQLLQSGCTLEGVPGFYRETDVSGVWNGKWNVKLKAPGIIIPVYGIDGRIAGLQIRLNKPINNRKYIWLSSTGLDGGSSSGAPIHFIGDPAAKRVFITDGALKGTAAHAITGYTFVCVPGINSLGRLDNLLSCLKANGTVEAVEAFNINKLTNEKTGESAAKLREKLYVHGFRVTSAVWGDKSLDGVDDYFLYRMKANRSHIHQAMAGSTDFSPAPPQLETPKVFSKINIGIAAAFAV